MTDIPGTGKLKISISKKEEVTAIPESNILNTANAETAEVIKKKEIYQSDSKSVAIWTLFGGATGLAIGIALSLLINKLLILLFIPGLLCGFIFWQMRKVFQKPIKESDLFLKRN